MVGARSRIAEAATLHRRAVAVADAAAAALEALGPAPRADVDDQQDLAERLRAAAAELAPGWLGTPLDAQSLSAPLGGPGLPAYVRLGVAQPLDDVRFPVVVPLLGTGHLSINADARDARVAGLLRSVLLRLLAAAPAGAVLVRAVDAAGAGTVFAPFAALADTGLMPPPAIDRDGLRAVLTEAERWVRQGRPESRRPRRERIMLLVVASLPELTESADLSRLIALAQHGPAAGLHLVVAGWPPPPLTAEVTQQPLPLATQVDLRNPHVLIGDPPGASFAAAGGPGVPVGLNSPVFLDEDPPAHLFERVCAELVACSAGADTPHLVDLLPAPGERIWAADSAEGLATAVGLDSDTPVSLHFNDLTPHWMVGGRSGAGKTAFLVNTLYGLCARYGPDQLRLYLLDFKEGVSFAEFTPSERDPSWLPQARAVGIESDREYGVAVLRELDAEMTRRSVAYKRAAVTRFADLRAAQAGPPLPRVVCVIDEFQVLLTGNDRLAAEAVALLESLARKGRSYGIHLVLASQTVRGVEALYAKRDSIFGQFPVRVALPGGGDVLEPTNESAAGLPLGTAVVNTAGGLGGPRGATRGHERMVRFPDPHADRATLTALRHRLWAGRDPGAEPPRVFTGYAHQRLADDLTYRQSLALLPARPSVLVGRVIDVELSTAQFPLDGSPGRHLAVLGPSEVGVDVLDAAARGLAAQHEPGSVTFHIGSLIAGGDAAAETLATDLAAAGHSVRRVSAPQLGAALAVPGPAYLVVFGMDATGGFGFGGPASEALRTLLREGPARGVHLIAWWRGVRRFSEDVGSREDVAGLLFLNVSGADVALLLGESVDWQPRANRVLLHDRHSNRTDLVVPFLRPEGDR